MERDVELRKWALVKALETPFAPGWADARNPEQPQAAEVIARAEAYLTFLSGSSESKGKE